MFKYQYVCYFYVTNHHSINPIFLTWQISSKVKTKLDTMCRTQKYQGHLVSIKRLMSFLINLLNHKELKNVIY